MNPLAKIKSIFSPKKKKKDKSKSANYPSYRSSKKASASGWRTWLKRFFIKSVIYGSIAGGIVVGILWLTLPDISELNKVSKVQSILIKSEDGQIIGSFGDVYGDYLRFNEFPSSLVDAVIATEDRNFYHHFGVDPIGVLRATFANIRAGHVVQGASTVTQQVAKNVFLTPERSYIRKAKEILLAFKLEHKFSKEAIMSIYLNRVYLGAGSYGVDAASKRYFGKSARDMNLAESAIMAGLLKAPSRYAPSSNPTLSRKRADQVLVNMEDAGFLTKKQSDRARAQLADSMKNKKPNSQSTFYFADYIADQLPEYVGNVDEDLVVTTTLRPEWQTMGEKSMTEVMDKNAEKMNVSQAALLAMSPDGAIRVMIGGRSYAESQYNRTTQSQRQPGSAFKMFVYLAGLEGGLTPDTVMEDAPITLPIAGGHWTPQNYTHKYAGQMTLKEALTESINTIAVQVSERVGRDKVINMAQRLGITADMQPVPSIALGATEVSLLELTNAYAHLASNGAIVYPYGIMEIKTTAGKSLYHREETAHGKVLDSGVVGMMNEMLKSVVTSGTGRGAQIGRDVAGKTGTTSDYKDAWFIGYTPDLVAGVWVGNDDNTPMKKVTGGTLPASIFHGFMGAALAGTPASQLPTGGGFFNALPWNTTAPEMSQRPAETLPSNQSEIPAEAQIPSPETPIAPENPAPPAPKPDPQKHDVQLGDSFWKKLKE